MSNIQILRALNSAIELKDRVSLIFGFIFIN